MRDKTGKTVLKLKIMFRRFQAAVLFSTKIGHMIPRNQNKISKLQWLCDQGNVEDGQQNKIMGYVPGPVIEVVSFKQ